MKRINVVSIIVAFIIFYPIGVIAQGDEMKTAQNEVLVPAKPILEGSVYKVKEENDQIVISKNENEGEIFTNNTYKIIGERIYVPKEWIHNILGQKVNYAKEVPILMYHHLLKENENNFKNNDAIIPVKMFQNHMDFLYTERYYTIKPEELEAYINEEISLPQKSIMITFDDGYKSNFVYAYPIMKKYEFQGTIFMISKAIYDYEVDFDPEIIQFMSHEEMNESKDIFTFASHTHSLHYLNHKKKSHLICKPKEEIINDLKLSMETLNTKYIAYPYGQYNKDTISILKELKYTLGFTIQRGTIKPKDDVFRLKRIGIYPHTTFEKFKKSIGTK